MVSDPSHEFGANGAKGGTADELSIATSLFSFCFAMMLQKRGSTESDDGAFCQVPLVVRAAASRGFFPVIILVVAVIIALALVLRRGVPGPDLAPIISVVIVVVVTSSPVELSCSSLIIIIFLWCLRPSRELPFLFTPWRGSSLLAISVAIAVSKDHLLFGRFPYDDRVGANDDWLWSIILCGPRVSLEFAGRSSFTLPLPLPRLKPVTFWLALVVSGWNARGRGVVIELDDLVLCNSSVLWATTADSRHIVP